MSNHEAQIDLILDYMRRRGSITPMIALKEFGCFRLGARIWDLRQRGHLINAVLISRGGKRFAAYSLVEGKRARAA